MSIRLDRLKNREYIPKYEELYTFLYSTNIDHIFDFEKYARDGELNIDIRHVDTRRSIRIKQLSGDYVIWIDHKKQDLGEYEYEKVEFYSFKSQSALVAVLREILNDFENNYRLV